MYYLQRKREERKFDPVGQRFTDDGRESQYQREKNDRLSTISRNTIDAKDQKWDILAHKGPPRKYEYMLNHPVETSTRSYNVMNGLDTVDHKAIPFIFNEDIVNHKIKTRKKKFVHVPGMYTLYIIHHTLYTIHYTLYIIHYTPYTIHCTLYTIHHTPYTIHYTIHHTPYTIHYKLGTRH